MSDEALPASATGPVELDVALMQRTAAGDMDAFRELVEAHQAQVIGTVAKMLGDDREAEDIAQQVFVRVWRSAGRYRPEAKFTTWLFTITRNLVFNELRRRQRRHTTSLDAEHEEYGLDHADESAVTPREAVLEAELEEAVQLAIDALPEVQRMAVVLRRYEDMPYEEIGAVLGLSVPAVKSVLFRARADLRARLERYLGK